MAPVLKKEDKEKFLRLLNFYPWTNEDLIRSCFGERKTGLLLRELKNEITSINRGDKKYYSLQPGNLTFLPGISRREMCRKFAVNTFGYRIIEYGASPYKNADFIFYDGKEKIWYRIWGDMGYLSPESLLIFREQPIFGSNLIDIIVTAQGGERAAFLKAQVESEWTEVGKNKVRIYDISDTSGKFIVPDTNGGGSDIEYDINMEDYPKINFSKSSVPKAYNDTKKKDITIQQIRNVQAALLSADLSISDYDLLRYIACNPFLRIDEIGLLYGGTSAAFNDTAGLKDERIKIFDTMDNVTRLEKLGMLKVLKTKKYFDRYILSWKALDLLGAYHGSIPLYMQKYCQWPQIKFTKEDFDSEKDAFTKDFPFFDSHNYYAEKWGENLYEHQKLCREFSNAIVTGARTLKSKYGIEIEADDLNTVAANLKVIRYVNGVKRTKPIHPDGRFTISYFDGKRIRNYQVFFEIERNTNSKQTLIEKIDTYKKVIPAAKNFYKSYDDIILIFFFDDSENKHGSVKNKTDILLERMKSCSITGYVSSYSLAAAEISDKWQPKHGNIEAEACGNMMLYRKIWRSTDSTDTTVLKSFLDVPDIF